MADSTFEITIGTTQAKVALEQLDASLDKTKIKAVETAMALDSVNKMPAATVSTQQAAKTLESRQTYPGGGAKAIKRDTIRDERIVDTLKNINESRLGNETLVKKIETEIAKTERGISRRSGTQDSLRRYTAPVQEPSMEVLIERALAKQRGMTSYARPADLERYKPARNVEWERALEEDRIASKKQFKSQLAKAPGWQATQETPSIFEDGTGQAALTARNMKELQGNAKKSVAKTTGEIQSAILTGGVQGQQEGIKETESKLKETTPKLLQAQQKQSKAIEAEQAFAARQPAYSGSKTQMEKMAAGYTDEEISKMSDDDLFKKSRRIQAENTLRQNGLSQLEASNRKEISAYRDHAGMMLKLDDDELRRTKTGTSRRLNDLLATKQLTKMELQDIQDGAVKRSKITKMQKMPTQAETDLLQAARLKGAERTMKGPGIIGSPFGSFSIIMSGLAATMFVWQNVLGAITSVVAAGNDYDQVLRKITGSSRLTERGVEVLGGKMRNMVKDGIDTKMIADSYQALRDSGMSVADSMKNLEKTTQLARYGFVSLKDAAYYVSTGNNTMVDYIMKMNKAMEGGAADKWDKFAGRIKLIAADFFVKEEPTFSKMLEDLSNWMDSNSDTVVKELMRISESLIALGKGFAYAVEFGIKYIDSVLNPLNTQAQIAADQIETNKYKQQSKDIEELTKLKEALNKIESKGSEADISPKDSKTKSLYLRRIQELEARSPVLRTPISDYVSEKFTPTEDKYNKEHNPLEGPLSTGPDIETDMAKVRSTWQEILAKIGVMSAGMKADAKIAINNTLTQMGRTPGISGDIAKEFRKVSMFQLDQQSMAKQMDTDKKLFETTGRTREQYWENERNNIKFRLENEVEFGRLSNENYKKQLKNELEGVRIRENAPRVAIHESIFADTGYMTKYLEDQKKLAIEHSRSKSEMMEDGPGKDRAISRANDRAAIQLIKLQREKYSIEISDMKSFYSESGILMENYNQLAAADINKQVEIAKSKYPKLIEAMDEFGRELRRKLQDEITAPLITQWEKYYSTTGKMADEHYLLINDKTSREADRLKKIVGEPRAEEWRKREVTKTEAQYLRGQDNPFDGIIAGMKELEAESRPIANTFADEWKSAASDIHSSFKDGFFDLMTADFTKLQDVINDILKRILKMVTDMTFEMMTKNLREGMSGGGAQDIMKSALSWAGIDMSGTPKSQNPSGFTGGDMGGAWSEAAATASDAAIEKAIAQMADVGNKTQTAISEVFMKPVSYTMATVDTMTVNNLVGGTGGGGGSGGIGGLLSGLFGSGGDDGSAAAIAQANSGGYMAKGGIFNQFGQVAFARGGIVNRPTVFPFARGTGLMGESGPEAILPLSRGAGGVLGVRAEGAGGGGGETNVIVHNYSGQPVQTRESNKGGMDKRTIEVMVGNAIASGGPASKAFETTYGLRRSGR